MVQEVDLHAAMAEETGNHPASPLAVIDIGATSMRMLVAQVDDEGQIHELEALQQAVTLGKDTFTSGSIGHRSVEECIAGLRNFLRVLREYGLAANDPHVRVLATSAVREAANRQAFLDRVYIATNLDVDVVDNAEVARFTYLGIRPFLGKRPFSSGDATLLVEVGGGSTEVIGLGGTSVLLSQAHRLGSLRIRQSQGERQAAESDWPSLVQNQTLRLADAVRPELPVGRKVRLVAMGGDARFAAHQLEPDWLGRGPIRLSARRWSALATELTSASPDELVQRYHLTYAAAETLGPALLAYSLLAEQFGLRWIYVTALTMRDGVLAEMVKPNVWEGGFTKQIIHSAIQLARRYQVDTAHAEHVAKMARKLFTFLRHEHGLDARYELILTLAAILHEVGMFVSNMSHHKHSYYLIANSDIFGLGARSIELVAQVARYHRRAEPKATHDAYNRLRRDERIAVSKLAAILRVADALERTHTQRVAKVNFERREDSLLITVQGLPDVSYEQMALAEKSSLFEQIFGCRVLLTRSRPQR